MDFENKITIIYCPGCRWLTRASWMAQELLITFEEEIAELTLKPSQKPGTFQILLNDQLIHCRKTSGGFPELKVIKRQIRDIVKPSKDLGHSEKK